LVSRKLHHHQAGTHTLSHQTVLGYRSNFLLLGLGLRLEF